MLIWEENKTAILPLKVVDGEDNASIPTTYPILSELDLAIQFILVECIILPQAQAIFPGRRSELVYELIILILISSFTEMEEYGNTRRHRLRSYQPVQDNFG